MEYPEHEKLAKIKDESQSIGEFLSWLRQDRWICELDEVKDQFYPTRESIESLLAEYFGINQDKLEQEKRQILAELRKQ